MKPLFKILTTLLLLTAMTRPAAGQYRRSTKPDFPNSEGAYRARQQAAAVAPVTAAAALGVPVADSASAKAAKAPASCPCRKCRRQARRLKPASQAAGRND